MSTHHREHRLDQVEVLTDWKVALETEIKRADVLDELGLLEDQALDVLTRRIRLWRNAVDALAQEMSAA